MNTRTRKKPITGALRLGDFLKMPFEADEQLLGAMILAKSIGMIAGLRGSGKSFLALILAYAIAGQKQVFPWGEGGGFPVAILDGEMRAAGLQERLASLHAFNSNKASANLAENQLHIISRDSMEETIGSIDTDEGQNRIDDLIPEDVRLIIVDNLSAWTSSGREDSGSWANIKGWLIKKRLNGIAVLLIHHAGKNGQQRGSSAHEDLLDYSILLTPLPSSLNREDTRFLVEHTKLRDFIPRLRHKFEFSIWADGTKLRFNSVRAETCVSELTAEIVGLRDEGMSPAAIAKLVGRNRSTVGRTLKRYDEAQSEGAADDVE